jgi:hypothetical protein
MRGQEFAATDAAAIDGVLTAGFLRQLTPYAPVRMAARTSAQFCAMPDDPSRRPWQDIARELAGAPNRQRARDLAEEVNRALERKESRYTPKP